MSKSSVALDAGGGQLERAPTSIALRQALLFAFLWLVAALASWGTADSSDAIGLADHLHLDPNTAAWWQLSSLPQIGTGLAKDIVAYRETSGGPRPFRRAADLENVPGIGPKTVQRLAKYLRFDEP